MNMNHPFFPPRYLIEGKKIIFERGEKTVLDSWESLVRKRYLAASQKRLVATVRQPSR
jgi:hypothetical protein